MKKNIIILIKKYLIKIFNTSLYYEAWLYAQDFENYDLEFVLDYGFYTTVSYRKKGSQDSFIQHYHKFYYKSDARDFVSENQKLHDILILEYVNKNTPTYESEEEMKLKKLNIVKVNEEN